MRRFIVLLSLVVLLCLPTGGCGKTENSEIRRDTRVLILATEKGLSPQAQEGLACFVDKVSQVSQGRLVVDVVESDDILDALENDVAMIFGTTAEMARANGNFNSYISPFYFYSYKHLSLTLNSKSFYDIIRDTNTSLMNAMPLAAFYDGSSVILSSREKMYDTVDQFAESVVNITEDDLLAEVLGGFGATVKQRSTEYILLNFARNRDNAVVECETMLLDQLYYPEIFEEFYICKSFHRARVNWLMLSHSAKESLSSFEQAVLTEAAAFALAKNDALVLAQEEKGIAAMRAKGALIVSPNYGEFSEAADKVLRASARYGSLWDWEQHVEVRRLATAMLSG